ncbi:MAG: DinB family protein [bacterium]
MTTQQFLLDLHERTHRTFEGLLKHCRELSEEELHREVDGFGYASVQLQLHHMIGAEKYWLGVLQGRMDIDDDAPDYPTVESLESYREQVSAATQVYLKGASETELDTARTMLTWGNKEHVLKPVHVITRTQTHIYQHQGQVLAMCRLFGKPCNGLDYPLKAQ